MNFISNLNAFSWRRCGEPRLGGATSACLPPTPPVAYLFLVRPSDFPTVSNLQRQSVIRSLRKLDALLGVSVTLLCTAAPLVPPNAAIGAASGTAALAVLAW